jgi:hypothetical protein
MTIQEVHNRFNLAVRKEQEGSFTPTEVSRFLDMAQMELFNSLYGNVRSFDPVSQRAAVGYGASQRINDALSPFKSKYTFTTSTTASGIVTLPSNYMFLISLTTTQYNSTLGRNINYGVSVVNEEELQSRLESQVVPVALTGPIAVINSGKQIQLFPDTAQNGFVFYFRRPLAPIYNYTQSGRTITYNPTGSQDLEWGEQDINNILVKALSYAGVSMSSNDIVAYSSQKDKEVE